LLKSFFHIIKESTRILLKNKILWLFGLFEIILLIIASILYGWMVESSSIISSSIICIPTFFVIFYFTTVIVTGHIFIVHEANGRKPTRLRDAITFGKVNVYKIMKLSLFFIPIAWVALSLKIYVEEFLGNKLAFLLVRELSQDFFFFFVVFAICAVIFPQKTSIPAIVRSIQMVFKQNWFIFSYFTFKVFLGLCLWGILIAVVMLSSLAFGSPELTGSEKHVFLTILEMPVLILIRGFFGYISIVWTSVIMIVGYINLSKTKDNTEIETIFEDSVRIENQTEISTKEGDDGTVL